MLVLQNLWELNIPSLGLVYNSFCTLGWKKHLGRGLRRLLVYASETHQAQMISDKTDQKERLVEWCTWCQLSTSMLDRS